MKKKEEIIDMGAVSEQKKVVENGKIFIIYYIINLLANRRE